MSAFSSSIVASSLAAKSALGRAYSAIAEAFHEGDRVYCGLHLDDLVIVQTE